MLFSEGVFSYFLIMGVDLETQSGHLIDAETMPERPGGQAILGFHFLMFFNRFWDPKSMPNGAPRLTLKLEGSLERGVGTRCDSSPEA